MNESRRARLINKIRMEGVTKYIKQTIRYRMWTTSLETLDMLYDACIHWLSRNQIGTPLYYHTSKMADTLMMVKYHEDQTWREENYYSH
jgi:hypothetical protein